MSGSTKFKDTKGASYDSTATADLSPVSESDEVFKSSGSEKDATASAQSATKTSKVKKEKNVSGGKSSKEAKKNPKK
jgi:hypothetical protein